MRVGGVEDRKLKMDNEMARYGIWKRGPANLLLALALALFLVRTAAAQAPAAEPGAELEVYLLTMGPGDAVWEKFGHNAIWIHDPARGTDQAYNYGMFDFEAEDFFPRFIEGDMLYWMAGYDARRTVIAYASMNRSVYAQKLNLTPEQERRLQEFLWWNEREENRFYPYDYYRDNCSTRVRDALDRVLGGQIEAALDTVATGTSYRWHTRHLTGDDVPVYTALDLAMGHPTDGELSAWEEAFLPMRLMRHVRDVRVLNEAGEPVPLVASEEVLFEAQREPLPAAPPERTLLYLMAGALVGALMAGLGVLAARGSAAGRAGLVVVGVAWALLAGVLGTTISLLWALTDHYATYANENVLQFNPLPLALVVLLPLFVLRNRAIHVAQWVAWTIAGFSVLGWLLQVFPGLDQENGAIIALALPIHCGLAWAVWRLARARHEAEEES